MSVEIRKWKPELAEDFEKESGRLHKALLTKGVRVAAPEHVGSTAARLDGKNIIDIAIRVSNLHEMGVVRDVLAGLGYVEGHDTHPERIFMARRAHSETASEGDFCGGAETREGDFHVHIVAAGSEEYRKMIWFRDFLLEHPGKAQEYTRLKYHLAKAEFPRKEYKKRKSEWIESLLREEFDEG